MYSDGLLKLPIFTIQKNFKILLTVYSLSPPTFTIINSTIVDSKSQGEVHYISELDITCFSAIDNSR